MEFLILFFVIVLFASLARSLAEQLEEYKTGEDN
jgi:hypothetical protein